MSFNVLGMDNYEKLQAGGHYMDQHFLTAPLEQNVISISSTFRQLIFKKAQEEHTKFGSHWKAISVFLGTYYFGTPGNLVSQLLWR